MLLTLELLPPMLDTAASTRDGRIVFMSSFRHDSAAPFDVARLHPKEQGYDRIREYDNTKLYNVGITVQIM